MHREPLVVPQGLGSDAAFHLMRVNRIFQLPCIDEGHRVVGLYQWNDLLSSSEELENEFVIMAGGQGVRLRPHTENCPKPLLPVGDKPMMQHIIERAAMEGFRNFTVAVNYLGQMIIDHFGDGSSLGVNIRYVEETEPLGTGGALSLLSTRPALPFLVSNGDVLTNIKYADILRFHVEHAAEATMTVRTHEMQHAFGVVHTEGLNIMAFEEKPIIKSQINAGIYVLNPLVLDRLDRGKHHDMPTLFERVIAAKGRAIVYPMHESWVDVGRIDDLERVRQGGQRLILRSR
jgi:NDP-sugar pyrophosphorylase family protein